VDTSQRRDLIRLIVLIDNHLGQPAYVLCECGHDSTEHRRGTGSCRGLDSYGIRCTCEWLWPWQG
jgi:hypothetical protein